MLPLLRGKFQPAAAFFRTELLELAVLCTAETASAGKQPQCFEQVGFSLRIVAVQNIDSGTRNPFTGRQIAESAECQPVDPHAASAREDTRLLLPAAFAA